MPEQTSGLEEAVNVGATTASHLSKLKTASHLSKAALAGGPFSAVIGAAIELSLIHI